MHPIILRILTFLSASILKPEILNFRISYLDLSCSASTVGCQERMGGIGRYRYGYVFFRETAKERMLNAFCSCLWCSSSYILLWSLRLLSSCRLSTQHTNGPNHNVCTGKTCLDPRWVPFQTILLLRTGITDQLEHRATPCCNQSINTSVSRSNIVSMFFPYIQDLIQNINWCILVPYGDKYLGI